MCLLLLYDVEKIGDWTRLTKLTVHAIHNFVYILNSMINPSRVCIVRAICRNVPWQHRPIENAIDSNFSPFKGILVYSRLLLHHLILTMPFLDVCLTHTQYRLLLFRHHRIDYLIANNSPRYVRVPVEVLSVCVQ